MRNRRAFVVFEKGQGLIDFCPASEVPSGAVILVEDLTEREARKFAKWHRELRQVAEGARDAHLATRKDRH